MGSLPQNWYILYLPLLRTLKLFLGENLRLVLIFDSTSK